MNRIVWCAAAFAVAAMPAYGQDADVSKLREELRQLQQRLQALEQRLQETESRSSKAEESATRAESTATQAAQQAASRPQTENALNPGISAILNGVYSNLQRDPNTYHISGFAPTLGDVSPGRRGLSLGESELGFMANVDHMFRGNLIASISPDNSTIDIEEGYIQTIGLSNGFTIKAGRFFSSIGYQNAIHAHAWDFTDEPVLRCRPRARPRPRLPGERPEQERLRLEQPVHASRRRHRGELRVAGRPVPLRHFAPGPRLYRSRLHRCERHRQLQRL